MQVVQTLEHLLDDPLHVLQRYAFVVRVDDQLQQIGAQHFEHHADMRTVNAGDQEIVQQLYDPVAVPVLRIRASYLEFQTEEKSRFSLSLPFTIKADRSRNSSLVRRRALTSLSSFISSIAVSV